jgi:amino acid adenylation domain-containing protein
MATDLGIPVRDVSPPLDTAALPPLQLPGDLARGPQVGFRPGVHARTLPAALAHDLEAPPEDFQPRFLAALQALLHRYTQQREIPVRLAAGRAPGGPSWLLGDVQPEDRVTDLLDRARPGRRRLVRPAGPADGGVAVTFVPDDDGEAPPAAPADGGPDLHLRVEKAEGGLGVAFHYNALRFDPAAVERIADHFVSVLGAVARAPATPVHALPLMADDERRRLLALCDGGDSDVPPRLMHRQFEQFASESPDAVAATYQGESVSYAALDRRSNQLAHELLGRGLRPGARVAVCVPPSPHVLTAILAVFKAGGVYVPLDPTHPPQRLKALLEDTQPLAVLTVSPLRPLLGDAGRALCFDTDWHTVERRPDTAPDVGPAPEDVAYIFYTSGTTGKPKGVEATHANLAHYLSVARGRYRFAPADVFCSIARFTFSISMFELLSPLTCGGRLVLLDRDHVLDPPRLAETLRGATVLHAGPSLLRALLRHVQGRPDLRGAFEGMRHASSGGDLVPPDVLEAMKDVFPNAELFVIYGCTEISCMGCTYPVPRHARVRKTLVGRPFPDVAIRLVDPADNPVPVGVVGEIQIGGKGVTAGYLGQPERTQERFFADGGRRYYRTGDMGRLDAEGNVEILGRQDFQIQLHGIRIELGEVEAALRAAPGVREAVVSTSEQEAGEKLLVGYVVPEPGREVDAGAVRTHLRERLPDYMVPSAFVALERMPLNHNLKVDRRALPAPTRRDLFRSRAFVAPATPSEQRLAGICRDVLGVERVGADDDLAALGANSLLALSLNSRLRDQTGLALPLASLFAGKTLRELAAELDARAPAGAAPSRFPIVPAGARPRLSHSQARIWYAHDVGGEGLAYSVPQVFDLPGDVDADRLERAVNRVVRRHATLRMSVAVEGGEPWPRFADAVHVPLERVALAAGEEGRLPALIRERLLRPFDLSRAPLLRATLFHGPGDRAVLFLNIHHIVYDEFSSRTLRRELAGFYEADGTGQDPDGLFPPLPVAFVDYAWSERLAHEGGRFAADVAYWRDALTPPPAPLDLPLDRPRPLKRACAGDSVHALVERDTVAALEALASGQSASLFMLLAASWAALLHRLSGHEDVVVGTAVANRLTADSEALVGCFINMVPLRNRVDPEEPFTALLGRVRRTCLEALEHGHVPFEDIVRAAAPPRDPSRTPLFQAAFIYEDARGAGPDGPLGLAPRPQSLYGALTDVTLWARRVAGGLELMVSYDVALFDGGTVSALLDQVVAGLASVAADAGVPVGLLDVLSAGAREQLRSFNATALALPDGPTFLDRVEGRVRARPDRPAARDARGAWTYGELDARANRIAHGLVGRGAGPGALVGICMPRGRDLLASALAVLKAGAGYVPLDPTYPKDRLEHMARDSGLRHVLCAAPTRGVLPDGRGGGPGGGWDLLCLDDMAGELAAAPATPPARAAGPRDVAYVIYTSGSTGLPKGVAVPHGAVSNLLAAMEREPGLGPDDRLVAVTTLSFDISVLELFLPLVVGAEVIIASEDQSRDAGSLAQLLRDAGATTMQATPTTWRMLLDGGHRFPPGFRALCGGEPMPKSLAKELLAQGVVLWNVYGPTETTVWSSCDRVDDPERITVGRPIANTAFYVLDGRGRRCPVGVPGELCIGGLGVALGYLNREELTRERFVADPFGEAEGGRMYRTGDSVRLLADGRYEHRGRLDTQVKLRGHRIELGEIEHAVTELGLAADCAACVVERGEADRRLVAFLVSPATADVARLRDALATRLPTYMVPQHFVELESLPRTPNGKVDRKPLVGHPIDWGGAAPDVVATAPRPLEDAVAQIFANALGVPRVGRDDDFFQLGGHSLLAVRVTNELCNALGFAFPLGTLFEYPTPRRVAALVRAPGKLRTSPILLSASDSEPALYLLVGVQIYRSLARRLAGRYSVYGVYVTRESLMVEEGAEPPALGDLAEDYVRVLREHQPRGPYRIGGVSFGGILAYEVAQRLRAQGEVVEHVLLLDALLPRTPGWRGVLGAVRRLTSLPWRDLARAVRQRVRARLSRAAGRRDERFEPRDFKDAQVRALDALRGRAYWKSAAAYMRAIRPYGGPVTLVVAGLRLAADPLAAPDCGWRGIASSLLVHRVETQHLSMLEEPFVGEVAGVCRSRLDETRTGSGPAGD